MADFDFSTLSSSDLEDLVCALLNAELPDGSDVRYKTFKDGKDKGIDFLYSTQINQFEHVGQVKHYYRTGFDGLYKKLKDTEVANAKTLSPDKYILGTSVDLTVKQTQDIYDLFKPYIKSLNDVYGKKNLNALIEIHEQILNDHYKLWFSDTTVLKKILNSNLIYRSVDFVENELTKRLRLYVKTPVMDVASLSLAQYNFIIITGDPGVGKTTLAEMLSYEYIKDGYEFLFISDDIKDADRFLRHDDTKQIVYYDDFLGSNAQEMNRAQGRETTLLNIISRVRRSANKKVIFTTRGHILSGAAEQSEKMARARLRVGETIFNLNEYDEQIKRSLLINHIDEADINDDLKAVLREEKVTEFMVKHTDFTPRSVELIMWPEHVESLSPAKYREYIFEKFGDPEEIWAHAYKQQIGDAERLLLNTLLTFDQPVKLEDLESAYNHRITDNDRAKMALGVNPFKTSISRLSGGLIKIRIARSILLVPL